MTAGQAQPAATGANAAASATAVVIGGQTVTPGASAVTISGTVYSLAATGNVLVVDGTSILAPVATQTATGTSSGLGGLIWSGLGGGGATVSASVVPATYTGAAVRHDRRIWQVVGVVGVAGMLLA